MEEQLENPSSSWTEENNSVAEETQAENAAVPEPANDAESEQRPRKSKVDKRIGKLMAREQAALARAQQAEERLRAYGEETTPVEDHAVNDVDEEQYDPAEEHQDNAEAFVTTEAVQNFQRNAQSLQSKYPDFEQVIRSSTDHLGWHELEALARMPAGPEIAYLIAKDPKLADELVAMGPYLAIAEFGKMATRLERQAEAPILRPPKPPTPVSKSSPSVNTGLSDDLDIKDWVKRRDRELTRR